MKYTKKLFTFTAAAIALILVFCSVSAFCAAEETRGSLTFVCDVGGAQLRLYKAGERTASGVQPTEQFKGYHVDLSSPNAAQTLAAYAQRDKLSPLAQTATAENGEALFDNLEQGVYLCVGDNFEKDGVRYSVMPAVIILPHDSGEQQNWRLRAQMKYEKQTETITSVSCCKIWKSEEGTADYHEVTAQLLCDGSVYDEVVLNEANNWKHTWSNLSGSHSWNVTEKELSADYTVEIVRSETLFTITNTTGPQQETTAPVETTAPTEPTSPSPFIPQTGQLNWPVPVLCFIGLALILLGILTVKKNNYDK